MTSTLADAVASEVHTAAVTRLREISRHALWQGDTDIATELDQLADDLEATHDRIGGGAR
ncbi:hypothetical protein [Nocardia sp. CNY236]|uniref:hypothetical protein n=1 Tax=Nocardia sp. CNY236 TaxID=1169152 RepID=UPI0004109867|nr:hypothetical protein [Nocardia sp. CNY236]